MSSRFENFNSTTEAFRRRTDMRPLRVKIWRWFTPIAVEEDGNRLVFNALQVASRWGNGDIRPQIAEDPDAQLALVADLGGLHYKTPLGLLAVHGTIEPVRLETFNTDADTHLPERQHALLEFREIAGAPQVKFR